MEEKIKEQTAFYENVVALNQCGYEEVADIVHLVPSKFESLSEFQWINLSWLENWIKTLDLSSINPIDNSELLCSHSNVDPNQIDQMKLISSKAYSLLAEKFGSNQSFSVRDCCSPCSTQLCNCILFILFYFIISYFYLL